jgi:hypothetical protein
MAIIAPVGLLYVPGQVVVPGDAAATAERLRTSAWIVRLGIASELAHQAIAVFLVLALYRLFKPVDASLSRQLVALGALVSVPIMFVNALNEIAALALANGGGSLSAFTRPQLDALAYLAMRLHGHGTTIASVFWGLWLFPFGMLVVRSGFIPRVLGILLFVAGGAYLVAAAALLVVTRLAPVVTPITGPLLAAELPIIVWLAFWGARARPAEIVQTA